MSPGYLRRAGWSQTPVCSHRDWMQRRSKLSAVNTAQWALEERSVERSPHPAHRISRSGSKIGPTAVQTTSSGRLTRIDPHAADRVRLTYAAASAAKPACSIAPRASTYKTAVVRTSPGQAQPPCLPSAAGATCRGRRLPRRARTYHTSFLILLMAPNDTALSA